MNYIISKIKQPCSVCGEITNRIDICTESRVCSKKCIAIKDKQYMEYISKIENEEEFYETN